MKEFIDFAQVSKVRGLKGELKLVLFDSFLPLKNIDSVRIFSKDYTVERLKKNDSNAVMKLGGVDNPQDAEELRGAIVSTQKSNITLPKGRYFFDEIIGIEVYSDDELVGTISDIIECKSADVYVIDEVKLSNSSAKCSFPALKKLILSVDVKDRKMIVDESVFKQVAFFEEGRK